MKRLILISSAITALATTLPLGLPAMAREHDQGRGKAERHDDGRPDDGRRDGGRRDEERRGDDRDHGRRDLREDDGRYAPRDARRGAYLPDNYRGGVVDDYQRFRLRPPPRGYAWVRVNGGFALVSVVDGRIFDVIPD